MQIRPYLIIFFIGILIMACNETKDLGNDDSEETAEVAYFADNGYGNAVAVVQHPAGIYHKDITYVCYQGPQEDPYVVSYNHKKGEWKGPFKVGISEMGKDENRKKKIDNHGKPSILIDNAGYIHIAFGGHGGMKKHGENPLGNYHYGKNLHAVSKNPLDISSWEILDNIPPFGTYNQFIKLDNGDIYLFYRHGAHRSDWVYQISTDNGRTFSHPISFLKHKRRQDQAAVDSWYPWISKGKGDELSIVFDYHICSDNNITGTQNGHIPKRYNVYYMTFNTKTNIWKNIAGEVLQAPITKELADAKALVARTDGNWTFQGVVDVDAKGYPHIGMTIGSEVEGGRKSAPKQMHYFNWDGAKWIHYESSNLPIGNGDIEVTSNDEVRFYIEEQSDDGLGEVTRWDADKKKNSFEKTKSLLTRKGADFAISALIENPHPDARLIAAERKPGTDFRKMYLLGDSGPVVRRENEAHVLTSEYDFKSLKNSVKWNLVFDDDCTKDWKKNWVLDGLEAKVENTEKGMHFSAGPEEKNDAHHAVLWTKQSFSGDIKIEYDYVRTDSATKFVNILYILATGLGNSEIAKDILEWSGARAIPKMRMYFEHMNLLHISYAAFGNENDDFYYVRARRYPKPKEKNFDVTRIEPSYDNRGNFKSGKQYHITAIKSANDLYFHMSSMDGEELFKWDLSNVDPILEGRIGLRHMFTRNAQYKNFKVYDMKI